MKTPDTINGKTPDEIKKGLEFGKDDCVECKCCLDECPYNDRCGFGFHQMVEVPSELLADALAYIQQLEDGIDKTLKLVQSADKQIREKLSQLESRLAQAERERDAALKEWKRTKMDSEGMCWTCKHGHITDIGSCRCVSPFPCDEGEEWEWRGVFEENTKEES